MRNYAEELAYWYFRFNGFFLINNYVTHPDDRKDKSHSDSDLLAVRIGKPHEKVGLNFKSVKKGVAPSKKLEELIRQCLGNEKLLEPELTGLICEVKAGSKTAIKSTNLNAQLNRLGFVEDVDTAREQILKHGFYLNENKYLVIRILISVDIVAEDGFKTLSIKTLLKYIKNRFHDLRNEKEGGWIMFESGLIQFLLKKHILK